MTPRNPSDLPVLRWERPVCRECGGQCGIFSVCDPDEVPENGVIGGVICVNRDCAHIQMLSLRADQAAINRGRELAERYGW